MTLNQKQAEFFHTLCRFGVWCESEGIEFIGAELFRSPEQAAINAANGVGIKNSVHRKKLAIDLFRLVNGKISWNKEDYRKAGEKWKTFHPSARWGGDFRRRDAVHFSFEHNGVM